MTIEQVFWLGAVALRPIIGSLREQFTGCRGGRRLKHFREGSISQGEEVSDE